MWDKVTGDVEADADAIDAGAKATFTVDMTSFDAGDWLKNRKLERTSTWRPTRRATFELARASRTWSATARSSRPTAEGVLRWRGKEVVLVLAGRGTLDDVRVEAIGHVRARHPQARPRPRRGS